MSLLNSIFDPAGTTRSSQSVSDGSVAPFIITGGQAFPNNMVDASTALSNSDLYAVTSLISSDISGTDFVGNSPFISLLNQPSTLVNGYTFWQTYMLSLLLSGNAIAVIKRDDKGLPAELVNVQTAQTTLNLDDVTGALTYSITSFGGDTPTGTFLPKDILHTRIMSWGTDTLQSLLGHSPLEALKPELSLQAMNHKLSMSTLKNVIAPTGILKLPEAGQMSPETKEHVRTDFEQANRGDNAGRVLVLDETAQYSTISVNADVAKYMTNLDWQRSQIAKVYGVPDSYLNGTGDQQSSIQMISALYVNGLNRYIEPLLSELRYKLDSGISLNMNQITDYSNQETVSNLINLVDKGIVMPEEAHTILQSKGVI